MLVLLTLAAGLPLQCGSWRAEYGHPYIGTQESSADDDSDGGHSRLAEEPGSPQPVQWREDGRTRWGHAVHLPTVACHLLVDNAGCKHTIIWKSMAAVVTLQLSFGC
jgi:hypothetical protein